MKDRFSQLLVFTYFGTTIAINALVSHAAERWLGWSKLMANFTGILIMLAMIIAGLWLCLRNPYKNNPIIKELTDTDFGKLTLYRRSWKSELEIDSLDTPLIFYGKKKCEPTQIQRATIITIQDTWDNWNKELNQAIHKLESQTVPHHSQKIDYEWIDLDSSDLAWKVYFNIPENTEASGFCAEFLQGRLTNLKKVY